MNAIVLANTEYVQRFGNPTSQTTSVTVERAVEENSAIRPILSAEVHFALITFLSYAYLFVGTLGVVTNVLVILTYSKLGFSETIYISYFFLAISDLCSSVIRSWGAICFVFVVMKTNLPFDPSSVSTTTSFYPGQGFEKTTGFITAFIAFERCLCVQFPLHVKTIVTKRKTILSIVIIFLFSFLPSNLIHMVYPLQWVFSPSKNRTILGMVPLETPLRYIIPRVLMAYYGTVLNFSALIAVWICTIFLAVGLKRKAGIRKENLVNPSNGTSDKQKERRVIKTVFLLAITYLACSLPLSATLLVPQFEPEFATMRASPKHGDLRLLGPPSGQGAGNGARTRDRRVPADLMADSLTFLLPTPPYYHIRRARLCEANQFIYIDIKGNGPQQGDLRLSGPPSGQGAGSGARTRDRMVPADLRADSQATVLPTPLPLCTQSGIP
ncbi:chemosensory receptor a [Plakobranchus ocellatus]|uniref:Chemosensory receptor a n=1 Tax=Plakobranchus ocellatus TaxID=259542 RepID=A0AAV3ZJ46_9GAST|nr:chemosensory receptor a [Plakobranchus ocellatus]